VTLRTQSRGREPKRGVELGAKRGWVPRGSGGKKKKGWQEEEEARGARRPSRIARLKASARKRKTRQERKGATGTVLIFQNV